MSQRDVSSLQTSMKAHDTDPTLSLGNDTNLQPVPRLWGIPLKYLSLVTLAVQNSFLTLIMHYSRISTPPERAYSAATAVLLNELFKGFISLSVAFFRLETNDTDAYPPRPNPPRTLIQRCRVLGKEVFAPDCWKLSIPAILYVIQNNLQYVAASNLDAATFQVSYQMKILTTAGFSVLLLRKKLTTTQWMALLCLAIGVGVVQIQSLPVGTPHPKRPVLHEMNSTKGFIAVFAACFTSGLAGVYFEMVLKNSQGDLWVRNVQLSLFSLLPALVPILFNDRSGALPGSAPWLAHLFHGFGLWAWMTVGVQVIGGLVTALVIKYSDNILKGFATSLSIVLSFLASVALFDFQMSFTFLLGSGIVLIATWLYNNQPKHRRPPPFPRAESNRWYRSSRGEIHSSTTSSRSSFDTSNIRLPMLRTSTDSLDTLSTNAPFTSDVKAGEQAPLRR